MGEINVVGVLTKQVDAALHSDNADRRQLADRILHHSGLMHFLDDPNTEGEITADLPLESDDIQPAMEATQMLATLAVNQQLAESERYL